MKVAQMVAITNRTNNISCMRVMADKTILGIGVKFECVEVWKYEG